MYENEMEGKGIQCEFDITLGFRECGSEWFELDPARVKQVVSHSLGIAQVPQTAQLTRKTTQLINLLTNAIKVAWSMPRGNSLKLTAWTSRSSSRKLLQHVESISFWTPRTAVQIARRRKLAVPALRMVAPNRRRRRRRSTSSFFLFRILESGSSSQSERGYSNGSSRETSAPMSRMGGMVWWDSQR